MNKARLYEKYRLPYAPELVDDIRRVAGDAAVVADIGAGTGQLARLFAPRCTQVYAVEPDTGMRDVAVEVLKGYPNIQVINACAEQITLGDDSIDLIVIGNAYHRFKAEAVYELRRILKPSGWVAIVSYLFTNHAFADQLFSQLGKIESLAARSAQNWHKLPLEALLGDGATQTLRYPQFFDENWEMFWGAAQSGIEAPEPHESDFARFEAINREVFQTFSVDGVIRIEYETRVILGQIG
ncbi:MAG TPA: class I SAM-dependent methyltransferase [Aggregatilineaceae bacterium]|nr:class I SAM-dependent methyltransferase [Aggregatilineaceae bacterium]